MFDGITSKFTGIMRTLSGKGKISEKNVRDAVDEIKEALSGNFCRCISHYQVIEAVQSIVKGGEQA